MSNRMSNRISCAFVRHNHRFRLEMQMPIRLFRIAFRTRNPLSANASLFAPSKQIAAQELATRFWCQTKGSCFPSRRSDIVQRPGLVFLC